MTGAGPRTASQLAADTGLHPRLVTEWLHAQTVSGYLTYDPAAETFELPNTWFPAVPGLVERLDAGARVADIGCGHGVSTLLMARHWPASTYVGVDFHEASIRTARARAADAGDPANVSFEVGDATDRGDGRYDVVVFFDALHDMGDPQGALRRARESLAEGGTVVAVEPWSTDRLEDGIDNPLVRLCFGISTAVWPPFP